tara:strand:- start:1869 stop:2054 length:186 start_codon:yes stop_codon:yes gene_type:complete
MENSSSALHFVQHDAKPVRIIRDGLHMPTGHGDLHETVPGDKPAKKKFKRYPTGYFHVDPG